MLLGFGHELISLSHTAVISSIRSSWRVSLWWFWWFGCRISSAEPLSCLSSYSLSVKRAIFLSRTEEYCKTYSNSSMFSLHSYCLLDSSDCTMRKIQQSHIFFPQYSAKTPPNGPSIWHTFRYVWSTQETNHKSCIFYYCKRCSYWWASRSLLYLFVLVRFRQWLSYSCWLIQDRWGWEGCGKSYSGQRRDWLASKWMSLCFVWFTLSVSSSECSSSTLRS